MGIFLNPINEAFKRRLNNEIYVDKTKLIEYTNKVLFSNRAFICNSRHRRFGKSVTADMLKAYYSKGCDSREVFKNYSIATFPAYEKYASN